MAHFFLAGELRAPIFWCTVYETKYCSCRCGKACRQHANLDVILRMKFIAPALFANMEVSARAVLTLSDIVCIYNKSQCLQGEWVKGSTTRCDTRVWFTAHRRLFVSS